MIRMMKKSEGTSFKWHKLQGEALISKERNHYDKLQIIKDYSANNLMHLVV